jgi:hypothetical protein
LEGSGGYYTSVTKLLVPRDENELVIVTSLLECDGIAYHIQNEQFGGLYPGLSIFPFNERVILVAESDFDRASLLLRDFLTAQEESPGPGATG